MLRLLLRKDEKVIREKEKVSKKDAIDIYNTKLSDYSITTEKEALDSIRKILDSERVKDNFGNGRFINNLIQDILFKHAVATRGVEINDMLFTITINDIPDKFINKDF